MKILVSGSSGLIGGALLKALSAAGHQAVPLVRTSHAPTAGAASWDPMADRMDAAVLADLDAVIHLGGENLAHGRWTAAKKVRIAESRVRPTGLLARTMAQLQRRPKIFLCASAIGFYGDRGDEILSEDSQVGKGYLPQVCRQWEAACAPAVEAGIRVVNMRFGVVLSAAGGALAQMVPPFRFGLGGNLGNGRQYVSWITLDDAIAAVMHLLEHSTFAGPVNVVAPQSVTNAQLTKALGRTLHRPTVFAMPAFAARLLLGEMADQLLLTSTRVTPQRLLGNGFVFGYPDIGEALAHLLARETSDSA
ncbi:MAG: TIGR01777 family oxidoreductase [Tepidisphaeraceae bacterium]